MKHDYADGRTVWKSSEIALAANVWQREFADHYGEGEEAPRGAKQRALKKIAAATGRALRTVEARFTVHGPSFNRARSEIVSTAALADLAARKAAEGAHSLTGSVFGDPPPGYSALDRKRRQGSLSR